MPALLVSKSPPLSGEVTIHGAKNSVLPILAATLLCRTPCVLHNCPDILDVTHTRAILHSLGCASERRGASVYIDPRSCAGHSIPPELAASMRASSLFLGAQLRQDENTVHLRGAPQLYAAQLFAEDLRGGAALLLAAMQAEGESTIFGVKHIERGYDTLEAALQSVGARLKTVEIPKKM